MKKIELKNMGLLAVDCGGKIEYGCNQEWYADEWGRHAGCGPSVVSTMLGYLRHRGARERLTRETWLELMDDVFLDVTPTFGGLPSTRHLTERIEKYFTRAGLDLRVTALDIPGNDASRPEFAEIRDYLEHALSLDAPVAFLNLDTGGLESLDEWHWTIIPSMTYGESGASAVNYNCGEEREVDIKKWYENTKLGGGLVSILPPE